MRWHVRGAMILAILLSMGIGFRGAVAQQATPEAAPAPSFLLEPVGGDTAYISETLDPGASTSVTVRLGNSGDTAQEARTFVADAYTLVNGGFGVKPEAEPKSGAATWIDYSAETLELEAGEVTERSLKITVPDSTLPGEYIAGLVVQSAAPIAVANSSMLKQTILKSIAVFITVPGPMTPALEIGEAAIVQRQNAASLQIEIQNTGNVLLKPTGTVTMIGDAGKILEAPVAMGSVYAGTATLLEIRLPATPAPGNYQVAVSLDDEKTGVAVDEQREAAATPPAGATPQVPIVVNAFDAEAVTDASSGAVQYANVAVAIQNRGNPIDGARVILHVTRDGDPVEDFPLTSGIALPVGPTVVQQRYIPIDGWQSGEYAFSVTVEAVSPTGQVTLLATAEASSTVTVP